MNNVEYTSIAVLMTCFNRKQKTLACLRALTKQKKIEPVGIKVFLVDDGCTDGTGNAVKTHYPEVHILQGDGNLFWNGGMCVAWKEALKLDYDYYFWLNDDSILFPIALRTMLDTVSYIKKIEAWPSIIVGSMKDPETEEFSYGGKRRRNKWLLLPFNNVIPGKKLKTCDTVNGNCVLVPKSIVAEIGILSKEFTHGIGDYDYGLRARKFGFQSWVAPGYLGNCSKNIQDKMSYDKDISYEKLVLLPSTPTSLPPAKEMMIFIRRHGGVFWVFFWIRYLVRGYFPQLWVLARRKKVKCL